VSLGLDKKGNLMTELASHGCTPKLTGGPTPGGYPESPSKAFSITSILPATLPGSGTIRWDGLQEPRDHTETELCTFSKSYYSVLW
jgi:hypothetical protein